MSSAPAQNDGGLSESELKLQRTLKYVVAGLGIAIIVGLSAVVLRIIYLANRPTAPASATFSQPSAQWQLELPKGAKIGSLAVSGNTLAVHYDGPGGAGIAIIDLSTGKRVADVMAVEAIPRN